MLSARQHGVKAVRLARAGHGDGGQLRNAEICPGPGARRAAPALLEHTLDVIRDEYQAFAAFDPEQLGQALDHLRQQMKSMEERIRPLRTAGEGVPCLSFRGLTASEVVQIKFWTTPGHLGNGLPAGSAGPAGGGAGALRCV